ncbi:MAG: hypothetical protein ACE5KV_03450 [Thermoplasmata archaeon]
MIDEEDGKSLAGCDIEGCDWSGEYPTERKANVALRAHSKVHKEGEGDTPPAALA